MSDLVSVLERKSQLYHGSHTPEAPPRGIGRLISGRAGPEDVPPVNSKSAIDGSGVDVRKEAMYFVSAISKWSRMSSRSSMR